MDNTQPITATGIMLNPEVRFVKTHPDAALPRANNDKLGVGDSGYDLTAVEDTIVPAARSVVVAVGLTLGYIDLGVIDNAYRGDLGVKLYNFSDKMYEVKKGDRIAQFVVYPLLQPRCSWSDKVVESDRGDSGFGSSGN